jgi:hypothetical protein
MLGGKQGNDVAYSDGLKERLRQDRERLLASLRMMRAGTFKTGDVDGAGNLTDRTPETIEMYERIAKEISDTLDWIEQNAPRP